jgi:PAS domain S-box-containing protein
MSSAEISRSQSPGSERDLGAHVVQFYGEDDFLLDDLSRFIGSALVAGNSAVVIATKAHRESLAQKLGAQRLDTSKAIQRGRYVSLDAADTLAEFVRDSALDAASFFERIGKIIVRAEAAAEAAPPRVVVFGEMVALLLAEGKTQLAIRLEQLWNEVIKIHPVTLRCAYPLSGFFRDQDRESFLRICAEHSAVIPDGHESVPDESRLTTASSHLRQRLVTDRATPPEREEPYRLFADAVQDYAIFMLDTEGRVSSWSKGAERVVGYLTSEIMGKHLSVFYPEEDVISGKPARDLGIAASQGRFESESWRVRKDGSKFWANEIITPLRDANGQLYGFGKVTRDFTDRKRAEMALHRSEERFRLLVESLPDCAVLMLDPEGHVSSWNIGAMRIKGYTASEIIGEHFSCFYPEETVRSGQPMRQLRIAESEGRLEHEGWQVRKDGSRFWANVLIAAIRDEERKLLGFAKVTRDFTERRHAQEALQKANKELAQEAAERKEAQQKLSNSERSLRQLSLHLLRTQDEERRRIGRDLHDSLGQYLAVMKINLDTLASFIDSEDEKARQHVSQCLRLVDESIKEVRTISYLLYPPLLEEMGLKSAIPWYVDGFAKRSGINTTFEVSSDFGRLPRDVELAMFRVLQESLTNVHRHSESSTADVRLSMEHGIATLEVRDHGKGISSGVLEEGSQDWIGSTGVGLRGMGERMRQLGGKLEVFSTREGTTVTAWVAVSESASALPMSA